MDDGVWKGVIGLFKQILKNVLFIQALRMQEKVAMERNKTKWSIAQAV